MREVLGAVETPVAVDLAAIPRFNESAGHGPTRLHPVEDYFDDLARHLVYEIYRRDFDLFRYDPTDPAQRAPLTGIVTFTVSVFLAPARITFSVTTPFLDSAFRRAFASGASAV